MIFGVGTDLLRISRMEKTLDRHGQRLPERILHPAEMENYQHARRPANFLAKSFAVKEATVKALGLGFRGIGYQDIGWTQDAKGKPELCFSEHGQNLLLELGVSRGFVSLTDEADMVMAFVVMEKMTESAVDVMTGDIEASPF